MNSSENPYQPPVATPPLPPVPRKIVWQIRVAWMAGIASIILSLRPLAHWIGESYLYGGGFYAPRAMVIEGVTNTVVLGLLCYGIYRHSRACAVIMLIAHLMPIAALMIAMRDLTPPQREALIPYLLRWLLLCVMVWQGIRGTFALKAR